MRLLVIMAVVSSATQHFPKIPLPKLAVHKFEITNKITLENLLQEEWNAFKHTFNKTYRSLDEELLRREIYIQNRHEIAIFNQLYGLGKRTFVQQLNPFADILSHEFNYLFNGFNRDPARRKSIPVASTYIPSANVAVPENVDWRQSGAVSSVKYQGSCACCYAFSAAGSLEGQYFRKTGILVELSPQNIMDCSIPLGNEGCDGGYIDTSFEYIRENPGIDHELAYPFEAKTDQCRFREEEVAANCTGYVEIPSGDEEALRVAVATIGPVSAAIDASQQSFQHYSKGIYYDENCRNTLEDLNHAVLVVGYGVEPNGQKYWLIKNSYSTLWGIGGYVKIARDQNNHCGIATQALYPLV